MKGRTIPRDQLTAQDKERMLVLLDSYFSGVTRAQFERDLEEKNWVVLVEDEAGDLRGFSTLLCYRTAFRHQPFRVVYSGDTIMDREARKSLELARAWIRAVRQLRSGSSEKIYWLLISSGFRTYRFLPLFWREFWPRHDAETPPEALLRLQALASERFGPAFDPERGIVRFSAPQVLRNGHLEIPPGRLRDPHIAFFVRKNPGYVLGDELVCLCDLSDENLTLAGRRMAAARGG